MSLFDLQDVCIAIGSLATLDLPMVVDLIGIYGLKGPYCTLTTTNWFLQALSVIPRRSWGDVARRSYHDPMGSTIAAAPLLSTSRRRRHAPSPPSPLFAGKSFPAKFDEENPSAPISSVLIVQADEGVSHLVVDRIDVVYRNLPIVFLFFRCLTGRHDPDPNSGIRAKVFGSQDRRALVAAVCHTMAHVCRWVLPHVDARWRTMGRDCAALVPAARPCVARKIRGGGRRSCEAPAMS
ncbi:hypothetical protein F511_36983 [Dorcoceras hygrometricum]|uniref:Acyl-CoA dehydrogenase-related protein n=1 Tax=Dorcoceras hygrometricum TaxID=472368 RepID=A0A2Z7AP99_9LAMI|nr:hypothetical protein F511_36983 [Dorcoceras hygrometricum]